jgi:threonine aldolase
MLIDGRQADPVSRALHQNGVHIDRDPSTVQHITRSLMDNGVLAQPISAESIRMCTHLDVGKAQVERAAEILRKTLRKAMPVMV